MEVINQQFTGKNWNLKKIFLGLGFIIVGLINLIIFGTEGGRYPRLGATLMFEGPSYFFTTGFFPLIIGVVQLGFALLKFNQIKITNSKENLVVSEKKFRTHTTTIQRNQIKGIICQNHEKNAKFLWLILFLPYFIYTFNHGPGNFFLPDLDEFPITGTVVTISGILCLILVILIIIQTPTEIQIFTKDGFYQLTLEIENKIQIQKIITALHAEKIMEENEAHIPSKMDKDTFIGVLAIIFGLWNIFLLQTLYSVLGEFISWSILYLGLFLLFKKYKQIEYNSNQLKIEDNNQQFALSKNVGKSHELLLLNLGEQEKLAQQKSEQFSFTQQIKYTLINPLTWIFIIFLLSWIPMTIIRMWEPIFYDSNLWSRALLSTIAHGVIYGILIYYTFQKEDYLVVKMGNKKFYRKLKGVQFSLSPEEKQTMNKMQRNRIIGVALLAIVSIGYYLIRPYLPNLTLFH